MLTDQVREMQLSFRALRGAGRSFFGSLLTTAS